MANTLPAPTEGLVYTNPTTGKRMKFSDGCWKSIDYLPIDGSDAMQGTLWTPDQMINGNTLTADSSDFDWTDWQGVNLPQVQWSSISSSDTTFMVVARSGGNFNHRIKYSEDGVNFSGSTGTLTECEWYDIEYGGGTWVAVAKSGSAKIAWSTDDGVSWTEETRGTDHYWKKVIYGNGRWVAFSTNRPSGSNVMYADSGDLSNWAWADPASVPQQAWMGAAYGGGKYVAVSNSGTNRVMYSDDAINWTAIPFPDGGDDNEWRSVTYGNGRFVAVAYYGPGPRIAYSDDGVNWTCIDAPNSSNLDYRWRNVTYGGGRFVAVSNTNSGAPHPIMYSYDGIDWELVDVSSSFGTSDWSSIAWNESVSKYVCTSAGHNPRGMSLYAPEGNLRFNEESIVTDKNAANARARELSGITSIQDDVKFFEDTAPDLTTAVDSFDPTVDITYPRGSLWYQPSTDNLHFYNDSDHTWVQL